MTDGPFFPDPKDDEKKEVKEPEELLSDEEEYSAEEDEVEYEDEEYVEFEGDEEEPLPELDTLPTISDSDPFFEIDDYEDKPTIPWMIIAIVSGVIGLGVVGWFLLSSGDAPSGKARLVTAETGPIKTRPDDPGGMEFPHQDKLVYNEVGGDAAPQAETLGPEAEQPMARPEPESAPAPEPEPAPEPTPIAEEPVLPPLPPRASDPEPEPAPVYVAQTPSEPAPVPAPAPVVDEPQTPYEEPDPVKDFAPEPAPVPVPDQYVPDQYGTATTEPSYPVASGYDWDNSFVLQLGAFSSRQRAEAAWDTYREGNEDVLVGARSNLLAKTTSAGIQVYALRAGPYRTREDAVAVRDALKGRGVDSFVVAP